MNASKDLVVLSLERWDGVWRRNQHLISGLLAAEPELRVLFVEPADDPAHDLRSGRRPDLGSGLRRIDDRLWGLRPVKWLPRRLDRRADDRLAQAAARAAEQLEMQHPMLWVNDPASVQLAQRTGWPVLYDMTDDWLAADRPEAEQQRIADGEAWLLEHATTVVACSPELVRRKSPQRVDIALVRNGVDTARYLTPMPRPADAPAEPYALYVGTLHRDRIDVDLCMATANAIHGKGRLVLIGPEAWSASDAQRVRDAGAIVLGARPHDQVPAYLQHADVLVVPHVVDAFTESLDPIKLYEYQAVGRPVVSTPVAGFRDTPNAQIAGGAAFAAAVAAAIPAGTRFPQDANATNADWSTRVAQLVALLSP
ncbi:teichuronic acid biosynthesis glycosyltransferase TuaH [Microbacterium sp. W4I4]|uniref:glycosyltransferase n=1 Tax=Microbacterium sp. W4I4 TaxID=3042295 RepID=UPI002786CDEB|nr:glycosyltransferase [Microbacterium sp. W4I4]MDQ0613763.1 teichuronic acid biosynthesis glycosyltransferase TuaH [Microbacterium sp. W4I4]